MAQSPAEVHLAEGGARQLGAVLPGTHLPWFVVRPSTTVCYGARMISLRFHLVLLCSAIALGCKTMPEKVDVAAPEPPDPGTVSLQFSGAFNRAVNGSGVTCETWDAESYDARATSADVEGPDSMPLWAVYIARSRHGEDAGMPHARLCLGQDTIDWKDCFEWEQPVDGPGRAFVKDSRGANLDLQLRRPSDSKTVRVRGELRCSTAATRNEVPEAVVQLLAHESGQTVRRFSTFDFGRARDLRAISAVVPESAGRPLVRRLHHRLGVGWVAFIGTSRWLGDEKHEGVEVVVGPGRDQLDILRLAHSDAVNYELGTEALVRKLGQWDQTMGIHIYHAETDTIELTLRRLPSNPMEFAKEVYDFCPDIVDQGIGTKAELADAIRETREVYLWWD